MKMRFGKVHLRGYRDAEGHEHSACGLFGEELSLERSAITCDECKQFLK
jgi:hypothetical protein